MSADPPHHSSLEPFTKLPLGGFDRRSIVSVLAEKGPITAKADVANAIAALTPAGTTFEEGDCVLVLGGSNGIMRSVVLQLAFAEKVPVRCVYYDSEKLQVGPHYARAIEAEAAARGLDVAFRNADATREDTAKDVVNGLKERFRRVHLLNGIAAGATKRYAQHGKIRVADLDVAFDPVRQIPDFSQVENLRRVGLVEVDIATEQDIERTNKAMGTSSLPWASALSAAGLLQKNGSVVAFADYDFAPDDPVYGMGPLAGAKLLQRESMKTIRETYGVKTARICYPAMNTTAIGAIPGALLLFACTAHLLLEEGTYQNLATLAKATMPLFTPSFSANELPLDQAFVRARNRYLAELESIHAGNLQAHLHRVLGNSAL